MSAPIETVLRHHKEILKLANERKFVRPIHVVSIAANGRILIWDYTDAPRDGGAELYSNLATSGPFTQPVHFLAVDSRGQALAAVLRDGKMRYGVIGADKF